MGVVLLAIVATVWVALPDSDEADRATRGGAADRTAASSSGGAARPAPTEQKDPSSAKEDVPPADPARIAKLIATIKGEGKDSAIAALKALAAIGPAAGEAAPVVAKILIDFEHVMEEFRRKNPTTFVNSGRFPHEAADALVAFGDASIAPMIQALADPTWGVHYHATNVLREIGVPAADALVHACHTGNDHARASAVEVLGFLGEERPQLLAEVARLLVDPKDDVRQAAATALAGYGTAAVPHLIVALGEGSTAWMAARALGRIGPEAIDAVPALARALESNSRRTREAAATALGGIGPAAASSAEALARLLYDKSEDVRETATRALVRIGRASIPSLVEVLNSDAPEARAAAASALGGRVPSDVFLSLLDAKEASVRRAGAIALSRRGLHADRAIPVLLESLDTGDLADVYAVDQMDAVASALARYPDLAKQTLPALLGAYEKLCSKHFPKGYSPSWGHFDNIRDAFVSLGTHDIPTLLRTLDSESKAVYYMGYEAVPKAGQVVLPELILLSRRGSLRAREAAVDVLDHFAKEHDSAREALRDRLSDSEPKIRIEAARPFWLHTKDAKTVVPVLLGVIEDRSEHRDDAALLLIKIGPDAGFAEDRIRAALKAETDGAVIYRLKKTIAAIEAARAKAVTPGGR